jgi:hypothetical protein
LYKAEIHQKFILGSKEMWDLSDNMTSDGDDEDIFNVDKITQTKIKVNVRKVYFYLGKIYLDADFLYLSAVRLIAVVLVRILGLFFFFFFFFFIRVLIPFGLPFLPAVGTVRCILFIIGVLLLGLALFLLRGLLRGLALLLLRGLLLGLALFLLRRLLRGLALLLLRADAGQQLG